MSLLKRLVLPIVVLVIAILVFVSIIKTKPQSQTMTKPQKVWRVNTVAVSPQSYSPQLTVYGRVETPFKASLKAALSADVITINAFEGNTVNAGDILVKLDDSDARLIVTQRQADLDEITAQIQSEITAYNRDKAVLENEKQLLQLSQKAVARAKKLEQTRLASQASLDDALSAEQKQLVVLKKLEHDIAQHPSRLAQLKAKQSRAHALLEQAQLDLSRCTIRSPFDGRIAKLNVAIGDRVRIGDELISTYDLSQLEVRAQIPGRLVDQISRILSEGQVVTAQASVADQSLQFKLVRLSGEVANDSGGIDGLFKLKSDDQSLAIGTFIQLTLTLTQQDNVIAIPYDALYGLDSVYLVKDGFLQNITITRIGEITTDSGQKQLLIASNQLKMGDKIVSTQLPNAITGLKVESLND
ncbi:MAG: HlyD family efflux transporter periplasmic adaptor subunit [Gammaproteobacteria bacterium]|nr:HlyD family efflux transporter periplasmic adaptor subunit [Gammaproteobacteria bacterium]